MQSILDQSFKEFELILVDDGSPDNCGKMCDAWAGKDSRIRVIHKPNGGLSDARNAGIDIAAGEYICFIDSDDWVAADMLKTLYDAITLNQADIACCNFVQVRPDGTEKKECDKIVPGTYTPDQYWEKSFASIPRTYYNVVWNKLFNRELFQNHRFAVGRINEDILIICDLITSSQKIVLTDYIGYYYLIREGSIMRNAKT